LELVELAEQLEPHSEELQERRAGLQGQQQKALEVLARRSEQLQERQAGSPGQPVYLSVDLQHLLRSVVLGEQLSLQPVALTVDLPQLRILVLSLPGLAGPDHLDLCLYLLRGRLRLRLLLDWRRAPLKASVLPGLV
jgi:hypothetical protein